MISKRCDTTKIPSIGQELFLNISLMEILKRSHLPKPSVNFTTYTTAEPVPSLKHTNSAPVLGTPASHSHFSHS